MNVARPGRFKIEYPEIENIPVFWVEAISPGDAIRQAKRITAIRISPKASAEETVR